MGNRERNPYVGPRPFERDDRAYFFGRAREIRDVVSLVIAQPVLLLYAASGAGKSSLLNAGVLPTLEERGADVLPPARVLAGDPPEDVPNVYVHALLTYLATGARGPTALADFLAGLPRRGDGALRVLVVDQFEELFTAFPRRWRDRSAFVDQLRDALEADPLLRVVLAIREDHLAQLDPLATHFPGGLRNRFRLERLDRDGALAAVENPLAQTTRRFQDGVAEALVDELLKLRVVAGGGRSVEVEGEYVEPVQLQVVCRDLWEELPPDADEITAEHLRAFADVDEVLARFYREAVAAAVATRRVRERRLRRWIGDELITPGGTRGAVYGTEAGVGDMPPEVISALVEKRLVRAEWRAGASWYELTHDRLIEPIRRSNAEYDAARRRRTVWIAAVLVFPVVAAALATVWDVGQGERPAELRAELEFSPLVPTASPSGIDVRFVLLTRGLAAQEAVVRADAFDARTNSKVGSKTVLVAFQRAGEQPRRLSVPLPDTAEIVRVRLSASAGGLTSRAIPISLVDRRPDLEPVFVSVQFTRSVIHLFAAAQNIGALTAPRTKLAVAVRVPKRPVIPGSMGRLENEAIGGIAVEVPRPDASSFLVTVTVDPDKAVAEANERNNSMTVRCHAPASACTKRG